MKVARYSRMVFFIYCAESILSMPLIVSGLIGRSFFSAATCYCTHGWLYACSAVYLLLGSLTSSLLTKSLTLTFSNLYLHTRALEAFAVERENPLLNVLDDFLLVSPRKGRLTAEHHVEDHSERPIIYLRAVLPTYDFGSDVEKAAVGLGHDLVLDEGLG